MATALPGKHPIITATATTTTIIIITIIIEPVSRRDVNDYGGPSFRCIPVTFDPFRQREAHLWRGGGGGWLAPGQGEGGISLSLSPPAPTQPSKINLAV